jgi:Lipocalin-like domain
MTVETATRSTESQPLAALLLGTWSLVSFEALGGGHTEYPFGPDAVGLLTYDEAGHVTVQVMKIGRPFFGSDDQDDGTVEELSAAFKGYAAYYGTYSVDEQARVITHHVAASMFPNWVGTDHRREAVLEGGRLTLSTRLTWHEGKEWLFRLVWRRLD